MNIKILRRKSSKNDKKLSGLERMLANEASWIHKWFFDDGWNEEN